MTLRVYDWQLNRVLIFHFSVFEMPKKVTALICLNISVYKDDDWEKKSENVFFWHQFPVVNTLQISESEICVSA